MWRQICGVQPERRGSSTHVAVPRCPGYPQVLKNRAAAHYDCEIKDLPAAVVMAAGGTGGILYWLAIFPGGCRLAYLACEINHALTPRLDAHLPGRDGGS